MDILVDTHALIWAATEPSRLGKEAASVLAEGRHTFLVSAASAWEIATKVRAGKLPVAILLEGNFEETMQKAGYRSLSISVAVALRAGRLRGAHKDPFDRMIAAQAIHLDIPIISNDKQLDSFGIQRIW